MGLRFLFPSLGCYSVGERFDLLLEETNMLILAVVPGAKHPIQVRGTYTKVPSMGRAAHKLAAQTGSRDID